MLGQIVGIQKAVNTSASRAVTETYHALQKPALLSGISRVYTPRDDEGERLPAESTRVQVTADQALAETAAQLTRLFDVTATKDWGNCEARGDVIVDGQTLLARVPVSYLLFLEKQLTDLATVIKTVPLLDPAESWERDPATGSWKTEPTQTVRTKKVPRNHVKAEATDKHPAQVELYYEDIPVGNWTTVKFSGALGAARKTAILTRIEKLQHAVKFAREQGNTHPVTDIPIGETVFGYLYAE